MIYQIYRNIKNQKLYRHIGTAKDSTNNREGKLVIIYQSLEEDSVIYARDKNEFDEKFQLVSGEAEIVHNFSVEIIKHFRCGSCNLWWSISDDSNCDTLRYCPHCGAKGNPSELP